MKANTIFLLCGAVILLMVVRTVYGVMTDEDYYILPNIVPGSMFLIGIVMGFGVSKSTMKQAVEYPTKGSPVALELERSIAILRAYSDTAWDIDPELHRVLVQELCRLEGLLAKFNHPGQFHEITVNMRTKIIPAQEPLFLLRGQDPLASKVVRHWVNEAIKIGVDEKTRVNALAIAEEMDDWGYKKVPDLY